MYFWMTAGLILGLITKGFRKISLQTVIQDRNGKGSERCDLSSEDKVGLQRTGSAVDWYGNLFTGKTSDWIFNGLLYPWRFAGSVWVD